MAKHETSAQCKVISDPNSIWPMSCPSTPAAFLFVFLFTGTTLAHFVQMFLYRKPYCWVICVSGAAQIATYVFRILSIDYPSNNDFYTEWFTLMMVAPVFTNAFVYMIMGRMVYNFTPTASIFRIKAWRFGKLFVLFDIVAFILQVVGAIMESVHDSEETALLGIRILMIGQGVQQACIFLFLGVATRLHLKLREQAESKDRSTGLKLLYVLYAVVLLITVRIIFRLMEYDNGLDSEIPEQEAYQYVLDSMLMFIASVLFNVFHPGRLMPGKESDIPTRKTRKELQKAGERPRNPNREAYLLPKFEVASPHRFEAPSLHFRQRSLPTAYHPPQRHYERL